MLGFCCIFVTLILIVYFVILTRLCADIFHKIIKCSLLELHIDTNIFMFQFHLKKIEHFCESEGIPKWKIRQHTGWYISFLRGHIKIAPSICPSARLCLRLFLCPGHNFVLHEWISI